LFILDTSQVFLKNEFKKKMNKDLFVYDKLKDAFKRGFISRVMNDIKIEWVTNIFVRQGIFGRILNYGNIGISSPGEVAGTVGFVGISDPIKVKAIIEDTLARYVGKKLN
jgi:hypothetical protein